MALGDVLRKSQWVDPERDQLLAEPLGSDYALCRKPRDRIPSAAWGVGRPANHSQLDRG
jgi:hypothetical protein